MTRYPDHLFESTDELAEIEDELEDIHRTLSKHEGKMEYLENQSRRNNIGIDGITEEGNETWLETETRAKQVLKEKLNLECEPDLEIKRAYRVCPEPKTRVPNVADGSTTKTRTIVCRLRQLETERRDPSGSTTNQTGLFVPEDLAAETLGK